MSRTYKQTNGQRKVTKQARKQWKRERELRHVREIADTRDYSVRPKA